MTAGCRAKLEEQRFVWDSATALPQILHCLCWFSFHLSVEWEVAAEGAKMHQARTAAEKHSHGRQTHLARLCSADRTEKPFFCSGERTRGFDDQVCSHQRPRLVIDRLRKALAKRTDGYERRDPYRDRK
ncbi:MAG: hypothetical protein DME58_10670 [Verrucomicrobia bacterium]|nr:MAG: hypothetical protein DME58_10670 [Verrucomicrobiota bacterium]